MHKFSFTVSQLRAMTKAKLLALANEIGWPDYSDHSREWLAEAIINAFGIES